MKYERLTNGNFDGQCDHWTSLAFMGGEIGCWNEAEERYMLCEECIHKQRYDRLKDLEDKIEGGALVELPFKVGDMVLAKTKWLNRIFYGRLTSIELDRFGLTYLVYDLVNKQYYKCQEVFLAKTEEEKRHEELRGEAVEEVIMTGPIVVGDIPEVEYETEVAEWKPTEVRRSGKRNNQKS